MNTTQQTNQGVAKILRSLAEGLVLIADDMSETEITGKAALSTAAAGKTRKTKPPVEVEEEEVEETFEQETEVEEEGFLEEAPVAASKKASKLTDKDVNNAAMAFAKKNGRPAVLEILSKKFKVKSILELKPEQYAVVVKALAV